MVSFGPKTDHERDDRDIASTLKKNCDNSLPTALPPYYATIRKNLNKI